MRSYLICRLVLASLGLVTAAAAAAPDPSLPTQLPRGIVPSHYDISITPHAEALTFDGNATASIDVLEPTASITLNALEVTFSSVQLMPSSGGPAIGAPSVSVDAEAQTATFTFPETIPAGEYRLTMSYAGRISTQPVGLFALDYETEAGKKRALYTQFEASDARRFVPSWDEPAYKATFTLDVTVPSGEMAVSNLPAASRTDLGGGLTRVQFQTSPEMSTYLLFLGVGDFDRATAISDGTEIGVVTQSGLSSQADFALESASAVLHEYNEYFSVPYPLPKLDNIAAPGRSQFFSAMENWGAIFTFEYALLLDPSISTQGDRQRVFNVAAHEMAHQWFGDLVTMAWWDDLWLNEGFASWMADRTTVKLHPEWDTALDASYRESAMALDSVATTHPVVQQVETVEQAGQAFDAITYSKGQAVIQMLEGYVGADAWRDGVQRYIKAHAHGNTVSDDLWSAIEAASDKSIITIAHDFTLQPGIPLIRVTSGACEDGKTTVRLAQEEFTRDRPGKMPQRWHVPVIAQSLGGLSVSTLINDGEATIDVAGCNPVLVNAGQTGYYRTLYEPADFEALRNRFRELAPIDQLGLMGDTWAQGLAGLQSPADYFDLLSAVPTDAAPQIWGAVAGVLGSLDSYYRGDNAGQARLEAFAIDKLSPVMARVGWEAREREPAPVTILRTELISVLSALGDTSVIDEARRRYAMQTTDPSAVPPALRRTILSVVARHADASIWDELHEAARTEMTPLVRDQLYRLLSSVEDEALARRALELALTDEPGATNSADMIRAVSSLHPDMAFDFAVAHRAEVNEFVDPISRTGYYPGLGSASVDPEMIDKIRAFADAYIAESSRREADTVIANIQYRLMIREDRLPAIDDWLEDNGG
jgi:aminopeptidase N